MLRCLLCQPTSEQLIWADGGCRVIAVDDADYPGYCRVIWNDHVAEMSDLTPTDSRHLINVVLATEIALRRILKPDKINLASLGNMVPHLHWHVIPRNADDRHFPDSIWSAPRRAARDRSRPDINVLHNGLVTALTEITCG